MSICYYFHPDGYTTAGRQVMGRHVAGESFLKGALLHGSKSDLWIQIEDKKHIKVFETIARSCGRHEPIHSINRSNLSRVSEPGCLYLPGLGLVSGLDIDLDLVMHHGASVESLTPQHPQQPWMQLQNYSQHQYSLGMP